MEQLTGVPIRGWMQFPYLVVAAITGTLLVVLGRICYNLFIHPLRDFPGPLAARASGLWKTYKISTGSLAQSVKQAHDKYGPVVRIASNELSFIESLAWKDIYGHHGSYEMRKDPEFYRIFGKHLPDSVITAERAEHSMLRRQLAHGFSDRSMRAQEPTIGGYVDLLISRLEELSRGEAPIDMRAWLNFTTFDIIGNLSFGSDFGCLENSYYHPWVKAIALNIKENALLRVMMKALPSSILYLIAESGLLKGRKANMEYAKQKIQDRLASAERSDLIEGLIKKKDVLSNRELELNAGLLVIAGSETTATLLSGASFLVASNPDVLRKITHEVRSSFQEEKEITLTSVSRLEYMLACLNESLRMYPPVPIGLPRIVPKGGMKIAGHWVPEDTTVAVWQLAAFMSKLNFADPELFRPERFLGDEKYAGDDREVLQPFSVGPRNCIGRNLAYAEMRLIFARLLFKFDIELAPEGRNWFPNQKIYSLWDKPELPMYLKPVQTAS